MTDRIVETSRKVTLLGAGQVTKAIFHESLSHAPFLVAADGGTKMALKYGAMPEIVIGDMDSIDEASRARIPPGRLHRIAEQESTDFDKALRSISAPLVIAVGFLGRRLDHQLAALASLVRLEHLPCLLLGKRDVCFHLRGEVALELEPGSRLSLFPMLPASGRSQGLKWPIEGLRLAPDGMVGTSNRVEEGPVRLAADGPGLLVILPRRALGAVVAALSGG